MVADTAHFGASPRGGTPVDVVLPPVTATELEAGLNDTNVVVVDAQEAGRFALAHLDGAVDFTPGEVSSQAADAISGRDQRILLYCTDADCTGSEELGRQLVDAGYTNVGRFPGGIAEWERSGRPIAGSRPPTT